MNDYCACKKKEKVYIILYSIFDAKNPGERLRSVEMLLSATNIIYLRKYRTFCHDYYYNLGMKP